MGLFPLDMDALRAALADRYPTLHVIDGGAGPLLSGTIAIEHGGRELAWFAAEIDLAPLSSGALPTVRETAGRIPWALDRHVRANGMACVCLPEDYFLRNPGQFDLVSFLDGPVRGYFIGQALVEQGEPWPHGEWRHGGDGYTDWFTEFLASLSPRQWRSYLETLAVRELKGHLVCPCGTGRRLRQCHLPLLQLLRRTIPPERAQELLTRSRSS